MDVKTSIDNGCIDNRLVVRGQVRGYEGWGGTGVHYTSGTIHSVHLTVSKKFGSSVRCVT